MIFDSRRQFGAWVTHSTMGEVHFRISVTHTEAKLCKIYWDFGEEGEGKNIKKNIKNKTGRFRGT